jgi:hypothetical protein
LVLRTLAIVTTLYACLAACTASSNETDAATSSVDGPEVEVGQFSVQLVAPDPATATTKAREGSTTIIGTVGDKPTAEPIVWETRSEQDRCQLRVPRVPFCDPACGSDVCIEDYTCEPDRMLLSIGTASVSGVRTDSGADQVELTSVRNTYQNGVTTLPYPAFDEGDAITLRATGSDAVPALEITGSGIARLEVPEDREYVVSGDQDLVLTWSPPGRADLSRIQIKLDISHHGGTKGEIACDVDDDGAFELPAAMIGELMALGVAGFPTIVITRSASDSAQLPMGRVHLRIYEYAERSVSIAGLVSCGSAADCPSDQTCRDDKTCGE